jgi:hypothetical protein
LGEANAVLPENLDLLIRVLAFALPVGALVVLVILLPWRLTKKHPEAALSEADAPARVVNGQSGPRDGPTDGAELATADAANVAVDLNPLMARIAVLEDGDDKSTLAPLYMQVAALEQKRGNEAGRLAALRAAAGTGAIHGPRKAHALARLELAEVAYLAGDLHTACEHWQMARMAYHDDGDTENFERVDRRMLDQGCPTDWVLTDF